MTEFSSRVLQKVALLFPRLEVEDLMPFLLNSRAVNAFDAVMLAVENVPMTNYEGVDRLTVVGPLKGSVVEVDLRR